MKLGFLGAGKMATAIAGGLLSQPDWSVEDLLAIDVAPSSRAAFTAATGVRCSDDPSCLLAMDIIVVAVKPQVAHDALAPLAERAGNSLFISIAAGLPLASLCSWIGHDRVIRVMPNTPAMVGLGAAVYACAAGATAHDRETVSRILTAVGCAMEMPETQLDAVTALSGSGPAYVFEMIQALVDAGIAVGLAPDAALNLTVQTVAGAAEMVRRGMGTPDQLRDAVTSPEGTTAAGLAVMHKQAFRALIAATVRAARDRSVELGQGN